MAGDRPEPRVSPPLKVAAFRCASCGAPVTLRAPGRTETAVCGSCGAILDARDPNHQVLSQDAKRRKFAPDIPLGCRGSLDSVTWEAIGFLRRCDGTGAYAWNEYLLYNPWRGFRWLIEADGHWTWVRMIPDLPDENVFGGMSYRGERYKPFLSGAARVLYVEGEFYWRVEAGETVQVQDFVCPPRILSLEVSEGEQIWSLGEYLPAEKVNDAFKIHQPPLQNGVAPCQPFPGGIRPAALAVLALLMLAVITAAQVFSAIAAAARPVAELDLTAHAAGPERQIVTPSFTLDGGSADVSLAAFAPVDNDWIYLDADLVNETTQESRPTDLELSYYHGVDDGESWSEGSQRVERLFSSVPAGTYHLAIETTLPDSTPVRDFHVSIVRDVPSWRGFWLLASPLLAFALILGAGSYGFEVKRWSQSDHPLVTFESGSGED